MKTTVCWLLQLLPFKFREGRRRPRGITGGRSTPYYKTKNMDPVTAWCRNSEWMVNVSIIISCWQGSNFLNSCMSLSITDCYNRHHCKDASLIPRRGSNMVKTSGNSPINFTELFLRFCCWTQIWLSRHWAWLCRGYWHYRSLIDWLMCMLVNVSVCVNITHGISTHSDFWFHTHAHTQRHAETPQANFLGCEKIFHTHGHTHTDNACIYSLILVCLVF